MTVMNPGHGESIVDMQAIDRNTLCQDMCPGCRKLLSRCLYMSMMVEVLEVPKD